MKHSRSSLFLMELIIAILFFSLSSAVCIQLFVKSHTLSRDAINQNNSIVYAQNLAEVWLSAEGDMKTAAVLLDNSVVREDGSLALFFDGDWTPIADSASADIRYAAILAETDGSERLSSDATASNQSASNAADSIASSDGLLHADVTVYEMPDKAIYALPLSHHIPERRGSHEPKQ